MKPNILPDGPGEIVATGGHEACDSPCQGRTGQRLEIHLFRLSPRRRSFGYDAKAATEPVARRLSPQLCAIAVTGTPLCTEPWQKNFKGVLPHADHVGSLTAQHPPDEPRLCPVRRMIFWLQHRTWPSPESRRSYFLDADIPDIWIRSAAVNRSGLIVAIPVAVLICRIDLRSASRNARLAFSQTPVTLPLAISRPLRVANDTPCADPWRFTNQASSMAPRFA
jgi:hypothetical protein